MPLVEIHLLEGRTNEQKKAMLGAVTRAIQESIGCPIETVRIWIQEIPRTEYMSAGVLASEKKSETPTGAASGQKRRS
jgi:4-oxalocrotonate tautomerase